MRGNLGLREVPHRAGESASETQPGRHGARLVLLLNFRHTPGWGLIVFTSDVLTPDFLCVIGQVSFAGDYAALVAESYILIGPSVAV